MPRPVIETNSNADAVKAQGAVFGIVKARAQAAGYSIHPDGSIIGKNAATGVDAPDKQRTTAWSDITDNGDGTFDIADLVDMSQQELQNLNSIMNPSMYNRVTRPDPVDDPE